MARNFAKMMPMKKITLSILALSALVAAGCGDNPEGADGTPVPESACTPIYNIQRHDRSDVEVCAYTNPVTGQSCTFSDGTHSGGHQCEGPLPNQTTTIPDTDPESDS